MANLLTSKQWNADTPATLWTTQAKLRHIEFLDYTADADTAVLTDLAGIPIWTANGAADLQPIRSGHIGWINNGLILTQISSGKVIIYTD